MCGGLQSSERPSISCKVESQRNSNDYPIGWIELSLDSVRECLAHTRVCAGRGCLRHRVAAGS